MTQIDKVQEILSDGDWHSSSEIKAEIGPGYGSPLAVVKKSAKLETRPSGKGRTLEYRLSQSNASPDSGGVPVQKISERIIAAALVADVPLQEFVIAAAESHADFVLQRAKKAFKSLSN